MTAGRRLKEKAPKGLPDPFTELTFRGQTHTAGIYLIFSYIPPFAQSVNHYLSHHRYFRCTGASRFRSWLSPPGVIFLFIGILLLVASGVTAADGNPNPWKAVNNAEGVTVWSRKVPASPLQEIKAETVVEAPPERVEYYVHTDPGGFIPVWLANKANTVTLPDLMKAVRQRSLDPNWKPK